ncbi:MAG: hypothetical protein JXB50_11350 [Spirochaetes bacterium]|nr:hypothetical protein [Spirochaetota bacterium]
MKNINYYLLETPLSKGKFIPRTILNNTYTDKELITVMRNKDSSLSEADIKKTLKLLVSSVQYLLSQGIAVYVPDFLKISPTVKGLFNSPEEGFNPSKHWVGINCTIASSLIDDFQKEVKVEKISKPSNWPDITAIYDCETKQNTIQTNYANHISGDYLILPDYKIEGINITSKSDINQSILIGANEIGIVSHKTKEITFTINKTFLPPVWLVNGMEILVKVRYISKNGYSKETDFYESVWVL